VETHLLLAAADRKPAGSVPHAERRQLPLAGAVEDHRKPAMEPS